MVNMPSPRVNLILEGQIRAHLLQGKSHREIVKIIKETNKIDISTFKVYKVRKRMDQGKENGSPNKRGPSIMTPKKLKKLKEMAKKTNPDPQREMAKKLNVSQTSVHYHIHRSLDMSTRKKKMVHRLPDSNKMKRLERCPVLKRIIEENKEKIFTSDESMFSVHLGGGKTKHYYEDKKGRQFDKVGDKFFEREEKFSSRLMVWGGVSYYGKSKLYFIKPGVKINGKYYQGSVVKRFHQTDEKKLFPDGDLFHQDSAPSHVSKSTVDYFDQIGINVIPKDVWPPKSPDLAIMDYFSWGWMKNRVRKSKFKTTAGLKRAIIRAWNDLPQKSIQNAFDSWANRVQKVIDAEGGHI